MTACFVSAPCAGVVQQGIFVRRQQRSPPRRLRPRPVAPCCSAPSRRPDPPAVKSSFYKNPSKAIEKGGGFYIPGLRGPRLRYFVGAAVLALIAANLRASALPLAAQPRSLLVSTAIGVAGALAVIATAVQDSSAEAAEEAAAIAAARTANPETSRSVASALRESAPSAALRAAAVDELAWVADVVRDMLGCGVWVFRGGESELLCVLADGVVPGGSHGDAGAVVDRVAKEGRAFYADDSQTLPEGIGFPFLSASEETLPAWSVFVVPLPGDKGVMAIARPKAAAIPPADRRWVETLAERLGEVLG
jgi:Cofactor assembly of complex C subunit B, CCB2/CCB4